MTRVAVIVATLLAGPAWSSDYNGHVLRELCIQSNGICHGFVAGVADAAISRGIACPPGTVLTGEMVDTVWRFMSQEDESWLDFSAYWLTTYALREQWPCGPQHHAGVVK